MALPLMVFAAGFGTRMRPITLKTPKALIPVAGRPLIDHALDLAEAAGAFPIVANLHYLPEPLAAHLEPRGVLCVTESPDILDTGGGLRNALPHLGNGPVWTMNPDVIWRGPNPLLLAKQHWRPDDMDALLICVPRDRTGGRKGRGDFDVSPRGVLTRGRDVVYGGVQILKTEILHEIGEAVFSLNAVWDMLISRGRCFGHVYPGHWCDVGRPENIALAETLIEAQRA